MKRKEVLVKLLTETKSPLFTNNHELFNYLDNSGFYEQAASTRFHGNYRGGLFDHSLEVTKKLLELTRDRKSVV